MPSHDTRIIRALVRALASTENQENAFIDCSTFSLQGDTTMCAIHSETATPRVTLYVRGDMFGANDQQNAVVGRLRELEASGRIDTYDVSVWNGRVRLTEDEGHKPPAVAAYEAFDAWADVAGVDIDPFFTVRERESFVDGVARELVLPVMCLEVRTDDGIATVAPNVRESDTITVQDCLDELETLEASPRAVAAE
jgi:hypothetical protein